ncbi:MAG: hydroxymethylglutaryl-CoA lyase [Chitinophagales bacterium]|jgi:hydroxymethylglutaryl-CoA lyase|nr:hydroxymethylglutaryl-CoA lyase [Chitinophagales bacterium]
MIKLVECPRDAMQGWNTHIPTEQKVAYLSQLLKVGFDTLDFGSFVSPKAIPQLADTAEVLAQLPEAEKTKLLAIVANIRGVENACQYERIEYVGFPFSISPTFQLRNTNSTMEQSLDTVKQLQELCIKNNKKAVVYISMGFGNPYGDAYSPELAAEWVDKMSSLDIPVVALSDTIGCSTPENIDYLFRTLIPAFPKMEIGAHLHTTPHTWEEKVAAAYMAGCRRFDGALKGIGGCPMAADVLTGNMPTENMIQYFEAQQLPLHLNKEALMESMRMAQDIFAH